MNVEHHISLKALNTFGVEAQALNFIAIKEENDLLKSYDTGIFDQDFFVLGGGSNVLFTKNYEGTILKISNKGIHHFIEGNYVYVTAQAGEIWNDLVWYCIDHGFPGLENMALIPGTVGASPIQNIGAYGAELMDFFYSCRALDTESGDFATFSNAQCAFTYRDSIFKSSHKGRYIITAVTYKLFLHATLNTSYGAIETELIKRGISAPTIKDVAEVVSHIRVEKLPDPKMIGNAGSFFKNPIISREKLGRLKNTFPEIVFYPMADNQFKIAAGWLIEQCGWKGKQVGEVAVWKNQALVLTNLKDATGVEILNVSTNIIDNVFSKFDIRLEREVNIL